MDELRHSCEERLSVLFRGEDRLWVDQRLRQELETIHTYGQTGAFKAAKGTIQMLREQGVCCRLIGAGCSSLVSYLMNLSEINPMEHGLIFERFLNGDSPRTIQFKFIAHWRNDRQGEVFLPLKDGLSNGAVSVQQSHSMEAIPWLVAEDICRTGRGFDLASIPMNDKATYEALRSSSIDGITQFEGTELEHLLSDLKPQCLTDIAAITAIQHEGAHESGGMEEYIRRGATQNNGLVGNWLVAETLRDTRGMILFQEQIMLILNRVADIPLADAYSFIKAVCKREWEHVAMVREWFLIEAEQNGMNGPDALTLFKDIRDAAARAVCKGHHLSKAITTYQAAFLKTHFPREFSRTLQIING